MELGISTDFANEPWELEEIKNKLREIAEAGFTHIHWCFDWDGDYLYARSEMEQIRSWMDELGLKEGTACFEGQPPICRKICRGTSWQKKTTCLSWSRTVSRASS